MQIVSQRLIKILKLLIESNKPISISEFAEILSVSRRTVFRELENIDIVLDKFNIKLETSLKEGLYLSGSKENIDEFKETILNTQKVTAFSKDDRRNTFALALLDNVDFQKLYYYSSILEVSESTLSLDLDVLEKEFNKFNVALLRKQGLGIAVQGLEKDLRKAMVYYLSKTQEQNGNNEILTSKFKFPKDNITAEVTNILSLMSLQLDWITPDTLKILQLRLCVQISRILKNQHVKDEEFFTKSGVLWQLSKKIADEIQKRFEIKLSDFEIIRISKGLMASRAKYKNPISEQEETQAYNKALSLTYMLIENFDDRLAPTLKNDEEFVRGLSVHLWSAIERIKNGYEIKDPLDGQIKAEFPDIYRRSAIAAHILRQELGKEVPEGEIVCIAAHFGAAVMQIGCKKLHRKLKVAIICLGGIGVSYMLNSQVKKHFSNEITAEVCDYNNKEQWQNSDFIISTIPLEISEKTVVNVSPILTKKDCDIIRNTIENTKTICASLQHEHTGELGENISNARKHLAEVQAILDNFANIVLSDIHTVEDIAKFASIHFTDTKEQSELIYKDLIRREEISSQVIKGLDLLLLHCVSSGVNQPIVAMLSPDKGNIKNAAEETAKVCLLALLPQTASAQAKAAIGLMSSELIEDDNFLNSLINIDETAVFIKLQQLMQTHLSQYFGHLFKL